MSLREQLSVSSITDSTMSLNIITVQVNSIIKHVSALLGVSQLFFRYRPTDCCLKGVMICLCSKAQYGRRKFSWNIDCGSIKPRRRRWHLCRQARFRTSSWSNESPSLSTRKCLMSLSTGNCVCVKQENSTFPYQQGNMLARSYPSTRKDVRRRLEDVLEGYTWWRT